MMTSVDNKPFFSIIVPVYKVEDYLNECVLSILTQTFTDFEIILVDDGSPDSCPQICDSLQEKDNRIRAIHKKNGGLSSARNAGLNVAAGDYVIFIDSDDYWNDALALERIFQNISAEDVDMVTWHRTYLNEGTGNQYIKGENKSEIYFTDIVNFLDHETKAASLEISACMRAVRRSIIEKNNLRFHEGVTTEDIEWSFNIFQHINSVYTMNSAHYVYRIGRNGSITSTIKEKNIIDYFSVFSACYNITESGKKELQEPLLHYLAYQYILLCAQSYKISSSEVFKDILKRLREIEKTGIMKYRNHPKVKKIGVIYDLFGYRGLVIVLGLYLKYKTK